jgi:uncharacterized membrane-anchored protein
MILVCLAQLAAPAWLLIRQERTLRHGDAFRFECVPVDPHDVFRGHYLALGFARTTVDAPADVRFSPGERVYVRIEQDKDGFARLTDPSKLPPSDGPFLRTRVAQAAVNGRLRLRLPFDRYYLEENAAPEAEEAYQERTREGAAKVWVEVRVRDGHAALEQLYLDDLPANEILRREASGNDDASTP